MKKLYLITLMLWLPFVSLHATENICITQWIQNSGKKHKPPKSLETLNISFVNELDGVKLKTQNKTSYYEYKSFIDIDGRLGISYDANNGNFLDLFKDGTLMIWQDNTPLLEANCPTLKLEIGKVK